MLHRNKLEIYETSKLICFTTHSPLQHTVRQNSLFLSAEVEGVNAYQGEQSSYKGKRNTMCARMSVCICTCVSLCVHWRMVVRVLCFTVFCHDALLYYSAQGALHMRNGFSLISTAAWGRECTQKQARANLFWGKKQIVVYFPGSGCRT